MTWNLLKSNISIRDIEMFFFENRHLMSLQGTKEVNSLFNGAGTCGTWPLRVANSAKAVWMKTWAEVSELNAFLDFGCAFWRGIISSNLDWIVVFKGTEWILMHVKKTVVASQPTTSGRKRAGHFSAAPAETKRLYVGLLSSRYHWMLILMNKQRRIAWPKLFSYTYSIIYMIIFIGTHVLPWFVICLDGSEKVGDFRGLQKYEQE